jgi:3-oxoacyl-[acyl-carrier protein] reductase
MKTVLIIGGSSGIGFASVKLFEKKGWNVVATYFSNTKIIKKETSIKWLYFDITNALEIESFIKKIPEINAIVICAAKNKTVTLDSFDQDVDSIFYTNIINQIKILSLLKKKLQKNSSIILFSSITGRIGSKRRIAYSSSKSAIYGAVKSLAAEFAPMVRVNAICPGYIKTTQYVRNSTMGEQERKKSILLNRLGQPEEVAELAVFLASDDSSYITGQSINIDGGVF